MDLGTGEIIVLVVTVALIFSASRMTALGNALGRFVSSMRRPAPDVGAEVAKELPPGA